MTKVCSVLPALALVGALGACVTVIPVEDRPRPLNFAWDLKPETTDKMSAEVEQGDVFFTWTATASATHVIPSTQLQLTVSSTTGGRLYCGQEPAGFGCYEDRDGNGRFDHRWKTVRRNKAPDVILSATSPEPLISEIPFEGITADAKSVVTNTLGLVFNGPVRGLLDDDMNFRFALGEFAIGWVDSKTARRIPEGEGWHSLRVFGLLVMDENNLMTTVQPLRFSFTALDLDTAGRLILEYSAEPVDGLTLTTKWDYEFEGGKPPEEWQEVSYHPAQAADSATRQTP